MAEQRFTIHQTGGTSALYAIERALAAEPDITEIVEESGRHYCVPDGDDLPEWTALRVYCRTDQDVGVYMSALEDRLARQLGKDVINQVTFAHF
ncbi:MAG: hypothetical protein R3C13_14640 [Hyphomonas sp.]|uniref:hypothetical protein n=1 Tax=Hyphomonas sp. TaxID=87 RepID=UPI0035279456